MPAVYRLFGNERGAPPRVSSLVAVRLAKCELRDDVRGSLNKRGAAAATSRQRSREAGDGSRVGARVPRSPGAGR